MRPTRKDSALVAAGAIIAGLSGFAFTWFVARATGPAGAGVVLTVTTWFTLLMTMGKLGMDTTLVREGGRIRAGGEGAGQLVLLRWTLWPVLGLTSGAGILVTLFAQPIGDWILADSPVPMAPLVAIAGLLLPLAVYTVVQLAFLRGLGAMSAYVWIEQVFKPGARVVLSALLWLVTLRGAIAYGVAWFLPVLIGAGLTLFVVTRTGRTWNGHRGAPGERSRVWRYSGPRAASQAVDIVNSSIGTVALGVLSTPDQTGAFATALRVAFAGQLAFQAVRLLVAPSFAALIAVGRIEDAQEVFGAGTSLIVLLAWPAFLVCVVIPEFVLSLFGSGFDSAASTLQVLALSGLLLAVVGNQGSVVLMSGRSPGALGAVSAGLAVNLAITFGMLHAWGAVAAAWGWTLSVAVEGAFLAWFMTQLGFRPLPRQSLQMALRVTVTIGLALVALRWLWPHATWLAVAVGIMGLALGLAWTLPTGRREFRMLTRGERVA